MTHPMHLTSVAPAEPVPWTRADTLGIAIPIVSAVVMVAAWRSLRKVDR